MSPPQTSSRADRKGELSYNERIPGVNRSIPSFKGAIPFSPFTAVMSPIFFYRYRTRYSASVHVMIAKSGVLNIGIHARCDAIGRAL